MFNPVLMGTVGDAELFDLWLRGCNEPESLSDTEATRYHLLLRAFSNSFGALYSAHQDGTFPEANWQGYERNFGEFLTQSSTIEQHRARDHCRDQNQNGDRCDQSCWTLEPRTLASRNWLWSGIEQLCNRVGNLLCVCA